MRNDLAALITTVLLFPAFSIGLPVQTGNAKNIASDRDDQRALNKQEGHPIPNNEGEKARHEAKGR
jgi:hypothetical protein